MPKAYVINAFAGDQRLQTAAERPLCGATARRTPAFLVNGRFLTQATTGVQRYACEILRELDKLSIDIELVTPFATAVHDVYENVRLRPLSPFGGHLWEQTTLPVACDAPLLCLCNLAPLMASQSVVCIHDANVFTMGMSYNRAFRTFYRKLLPRIARRASIISTVSQTAACDLARHLDLPSGRMRIVPNGHEHALRWRSERSSFAGCIADWRPFVLVIGSVAPHKNISRVVGIGEALAGLGLDVVVAGSSKGPYAATPKASAENVRYLGRVSDDDLACLLDHALCLAFPSRQEGFGIPIIEAMARGCPVVASDVSSLPEICGDAALLADPEIDEPWYRHIKALSRSQALRDDLRGRGTENARRYSWQASASAYAELMLQI